jgi:thioredoxin 1
MGVATAVTDAAFAGDVLGATKPVVVDFWAEWCTQCGRVETMIEAIAATELGTKAEFRKVDIDANPKITEAYAVRSVPTVIVFKGGEPVGIIPGIRPKSELIRLIESAL